MPTQLAIDGGKPVRDVQQKPWPTWPSSREEDWVRRVEPAMRAVYLSKVEGLPGSQAQVFNQKFAAYCGTKYARLLVHGTDAIAAALSAVLDLDAWGDGGEVILPNYTFIAMRQCRHRAAVHARLRRHRPSDADHVPAGPRGRDRAGQDASDHAGASRRTPGGHERDQCHRCPAQP